MAPDDGAFCRRLSGLCEDADVDFSTFHFLPSNLAVHEEHTADSVGFDPMSPAALVPQEGLAAGPQPDARQEDSATERGEAEDARGGLKADSSDPLLFTDGMECHATNADLANSPTPESRKPLAGHRLIQPRPSSSNTAGFTFQEIDAITSEDGHLAYPERKLLRGRMDRLDRGDIFLSHAIQVVGRRRSQSVPPNDMSFHRQLGTGGKLHIGRPARRPTGSAQRPHPYDNARLKRFSGGRNASPNQRLMTVPPQIPRGCQHLDGTVYPPASHTVNPAAFGIRLQQNPSVLESTRPHPDFAAGGDRFRPHINVALQQAPARKVPLADFQHLCERLLYRLGAAVEGTRRDAMTMGQDPALDMCVSYRPQWSF